ncbi:hypothetical protein [Salirhabdus sp. Marseille-P4669]|uniref:hypothetical protein n=1 Tax=Salirhabdus sp. Marseille-P4669 TaxID=2042310 RepID=UPI00135AD005|nr:hypothetical protein [Salirhabdus sp. Marseille-P4669]
MLITIIAFFPNPALFHLFWQGYPLIVRYTFRAVEFGFLVFGNGDTTDGVS